ncbi:MAG: RNA-binding protein [Deltaproteobacteria bacterium]|jgi:RNA recognition motif-containing protein|nr:RNA-binding protein [Deltaproteobacteria bacterium]MBW2537205.1 RNA-binding protein [Deltaproteobacteria bacterium]
MGRNRSRSFIKRKKEQERQEKAAHKRARRRARGSSSGGTDDESLGDIVPGPQPKDAPSQQEVQLAIERAMNPRNKAARDSRTPSFGARLFVGNLAATVQEHEVCALFAKAGFEVSEAFMPRDRATGESRCIAFVELTNARDAKRAIEALDGASFHSQSLRVNAADQGRSR